MKTNFIDHVRICCRSGKGGAGSRHMFRSRSVTEGGPDGGDGGRGGHVIIEGNKQLWTLLHLRYKKHIIASEGKAGSKSESTGAQGQYRVKYTESESDIQNYNFFYKNTPKAKILSNLFNIFEQIEKIQNIRKYIL